MVFFDDILVYRPSFQDYMAHLMLVLATMEENSLFAKWSKCSFGGSQIEYLGHVISGEGVSTEKSKVVAVRV